MKDITIRATMAPGDAFPFLEYVNPNSSGIFTIEGAPVGTIRITISIPQYVDPNWESAIKDVEVNGDLEQIEIVLARKAGLPDPIKPKLDDNDDSSPE